MGRYMINMYSDPFQQMWQSSLKMLTDYGDKNWCESQRLVEEATDENGKKFMTETALAAYSSA